MKRILLPLLIITFISCGQSLDNGQVFHETYVVEGIPGKRNFEKLSYGEKFVDSSMMADSQDNGLPFANNRSRIFKESFTDGKSASVDSSLTEGLSAMCMCMLKNDTIHIKTFAGFFSGFVFDIDVSKKGAFNSVYKQVADDAAPYKANLTDTFSGSVTVKPRFQYLNFDEKPLFKDSQQLTGYYTMTSEKFYERSWPGKLDTNIVKAKIFFTCITKN